MTIAYRREHALPVADFRRVLVESGLGASRPVDDQVRLQRMLDGAQLVVSARRGDEIVGVARCITDFSWNCYLNELAVCASAQGSGIGKGLIATLRSILGPEVSLILASEPDAVPFYEGIGMRRMADAFWFRRTR